MCYGNLESSFINLSRERHTEVELVYIEMYKGRYREEGTGGDHGREGVGRGQRRMDGG